MIKKGVQNWEELQQNLNRLNSEIYLIQNLENVNNILRYISEQEELIRNSTSQSGLDKVCLTKIQGIRKKLVNYYSDQKNTTIDLALDTLNKIILGLSQDFIQNINQNKNKKLVLEFTTSEEIAPEVKEKIKNKIAGIREIPAKNIEIEFIQLRTTKSENNIDSFVSSILGVNAKLNLNIKDLGVEKAKKEIKIQENLQPTVEEEKKKNLNQLLELQKIEAKIEKDLDKQANELDKRIQERRRRKELKALDKGKSSYIKEGSPVINKSIQEEGRVVLENIEDVLERCNISNVSEKEINEAEELIKDRIEEIYDKICASNLEEISEIFYKNTSRSNSFNLSKNISRQNISKELNISNKIKEERGYLKNLITEKSQNENSILMERSSFNSYNLKTEEDYLEKLTNFLPHLQPQNKDRTQNLKPILEDLKKAEERYQESINLSIQEKSRSYNFSPGKKNKRLSSLPLEESHYVIKNEIPKFETRNNLNLPQGANLSRMIPNYNESLYSNNIDEQESIVERGYNFQSNFGNKKLPDSDFGIKMVSPKKYNFEEEQNPRISHERFNELENRKSSRIFSEEIEYEKKPSFDKSHIELDRESINFESEEFIPGCNIFCGNEVKVEERTTFKNELKNKVKEILKNSQQILKEKTKVDLKFNNDFFEKYYDIIINNIKENNIKDVKFDEIYKRTTKKPIKTDTNDAIYIFKENFNNNEFNRLTEEQKHNSLFYFTAIAQSICLNCSEKNLNNSQELKNYLNQQIEERGIEDFSRIKSTPRDSNNSNYTFSPEKHKVSESRKLERQESHIKFLTEDELKEKENNNKEIKVKRTKKIFERTNPSRNLQNIRGLNNLKI